jgi:hypothetical protein
MHSTLLLHPLHQQHYPPHLRQVSLIITVISLCHASGCCRCCCRCCWVLEQRNACPHLCILLQLLQEPLTVRCICCLIAPPEDMCNNNSSFSVLLLA